MAYEKTDSPTEDAGTVEGAFLSEMRDRYDRAREREDENLKQAYFDLGLRAGDIDCHWDPQAKNERLAEGRPCMVINMVPQFVRQVTGDIRQMKPAIKVVAVDDQADPDTAEKLSGLIRYIENRSDAQDAYFKGADSQVTAGVGHWRVLSEYAADSTFEQELRISPIEDGVAVLWDPDSILPTKEDANYCFVPVDMTRAAFDKKYPGKSPDELSLTEWRWTSEWSSDDHVRVVEYWTKTEDKKLIARLPEGGVVDLDNIEDEAQLAALYAEAKIEEVDGFKVERHLCSATSILEKADEWIGRFIPIVPCWGEETRIGRRVARHGMVYHMRDVQRIYNYFASAETEIVALQPKSPFIGTEKNFQLNRSMWEQANKKNFPYLVYDPDAKNGGQIPSRVQPPVSSQGITEGLARAEQDLYRVTGIYPSALGQKSNEASGKAIMARQQESDTGTVHYLDNFTRAIRHTGRILIDAIPKVYDTTRTVRILGEDGQIDKVEINKPTMRMVGLQMEQAYENDVTVGSYDVMAQAGPSYTTKREEAKEGMMMLMQSVPDIAPIITDLVAQAQDWPLAEQISERLRIMLPPQVLEAEKAKEQGSDLDQMPPKEPPPDPRAQAEAEKMQTETAQSQQKMQIDAMQAQQEMQLKSQQMSFDIEMKRLELETKRETAALDLQIKQTQLLIARASLNQREQAPQERSAG